MLKPSLSKNSIVTLTAIAATALILSVYSYRYYTSSSEKIVDIASQEIISNARIQVHDLSQLLSNRLQTITALLQTLADAPALQNNEYQRAYVVTNYRQNYTSELTDFYMWLDKDGKIVWISNLNSSDFEKYKSLDLSYRSYFTEPKNTHAAYYSSLIESNDKVPRMYISYPILGKQGPQYNTNNPSNGTKTDSFKGVVVAAAKGITIGDILKNQLLPQFNSTLSLLDNNGIILYTNNQSFIGKNIFGSEFQSTLTTMLSPSSKESLNQLLNRSMQGYSSGIGSIHIQGRLNTIAYEPVTIKGTHFLTLFITAPHNLTSNVALAVDEQRNFSTFTIIAIGAVALGAALLVLTWNRRLEHTVNSRTEELHKANILLTESNKQLALANEQLKHHEKMQTEFINVAAHELRTPIQPIIAVAELLKSKIKEKEQSNMLDVLIRNAKRFQRLSQDILDITQIEGRSLNLKKERLDLHQLIANIIEDHRQLIQNSNPKPELLYEAPQSAEDKEPKNPVLVEADKERIIQVICNLLSNAIKFTKEGTISISTMIKQNDQGEKGSEVVVCVKDTGQGIDPDIQSRLFSKFATSSSQGTGLGLYISKGIIEAHGGNIWVEKNTSDRKGTWFCFSLPLAYA
jgi:signal transduction histidine kinase